MNEKHLKLAANRTRPNLRHIQPDLWHVDDYAINIRRDRHDECLALRLPQSARDALDLTVMQANTRDRRLRVPVACFPGS